MINNVKTIVLFLINLFILLTLISCQSSVNQSQVPVTREVSTPDPAKLPLAEEVERSLNRKECPVHCWHNLRLGQTEEEAVKAIREDPTTDTTFRFNDGDFIRIEHFREDGTGSISWRVEEQPENLGSVGLNEEGFVNSIIVPLDSWLPLQNYLARLGSPELVNIGPLESAWAVMSLMYPEEGVEFKVRFTGSPPIVSEEKLVERVAFYDSAVATVFRCVKGYTQWGGFGEITRYLPPQNQDIVVTSLPEECPNDP